MSNENKTIFIQIASYRDPELPPTVKDCIKNAKYPERLRFGICRQYAREDKGIDGLLDYQDDDRFSIMNVNYKKAQGVCWARNKIQDMYKGEDYVLQLDSHHRFVKDWDEKTINDLESLRSEHPKPILTAYLPSYDPEQKSSKVMLPWEMRFDRFLPQGPAMPKPETIDDHKAHDKPVRAYMLSGHFIFTNGDFFDKVPYDPELYFHGEEISLAIRAFTHGYDLFAPHRLLAWHHYTREGSKRHWDDVGDWGDKNSKSFERYRKLVKIDKSKPGELGEHGLGKERTLKQYIKYSGIDVTNKRIHKANLDRQRAPMKYKPGKYQSGFCKKIRYCIDLFKGAVPLNDYTVWVTAFRDMEGNEIHRKDLSPREITALKSDKDQFCRIWVEFESPTEPVEWMVWPHSESKEWCDQIVNKIEVG